MGVDSKVVMRYVAEIRVREAHQEEMIDKVTCMIS